MTIFSDLTNIAQGSEKRRICIGTVTRDRPKMLQNLLASYAELRVPRDVTLHFIIVENASIASLHEVVEHFRSQVPHWTVQYETESGLGIASARNRVLECALEGMYDLLTFADDDEVVDPKWLVSLLRERDRFGLDIVGSPVRFSPPRLVLSRWQKIVWSGINMTNRRSEAASALKRSEGKGDCIKIATGSWMGNLHFFRRTNLRFDQSLGLAGGEDWRLWAHAKRLGAKSGWAPDAIVHEAIPSARISLRYQFKRQRDHNRSEIRAKFRDRPTKALIRLPGSVATRLLKIGIALLAIPFTRGRTLVPIASNIGSLIGLFEGSAGRKSAHYQRTTGT